MGVQHKRRTGFPAVDGVAPAEIGSGRRLMLGIVCHAGGSGQRIHRRLYVTVPDQGFQPLDQVVKILDVFVQPFHTGQGFFIVGSCLREVPLLFIGRRSLLQRECQLQIFAFRCGLGIQSLQLFDRPDDPRSVIFLQCRCIFRLNRPVGCRDIRIYGTGHQPHGDTDQQKGDHSLPARHFQSPPIILSYFNKNYLPFILYHIFPELSMFP